MKPLSPCIHSINLQLAYSKVPRRTTRQWRQNLALISLALILVARAPNLRAVDEDIDSHDEALMFAQAGRVRRQIEREGDPNAPMRQPVIVLGPQLSSLNDYRSRNGGVPIECFEIGGGRIDPPVPGDLRFKPVALRTVVEQGAELRNAQVIWRRDNTVAVFYRLAPEDILSQLRLRFRSKEPAKVALAAWEAGCLQDLRLVLPLIRAAKDEDPEVATAAWLGLRRMGLETIALLYPESLLPLLVAHLPPATPDPSGHGVVDTAVISALGHIDRADAARALIRHLDALGTYQRQMVLGALAKHRSEPAVEFWDHRIDAMTAHPAGVTHDELYTLLAILCNHNPDRALPLADFFAQHGSADQVDTARIFLAELGGPRALKFFDSLPKPTNDDDLRLWLRQRAEAGDLAARREFWRYLISHDSNTYDGPLAHLDLLPEADRLSFCMSQLESTDLFTRRRACEQLAQMIDDRVEEALAAVAANRDQDEAVRCAAIRALGNRGSLRACQLIKKFLSADQPVAMRHTTIQALGACVRDEVWTILWPLAKNAQEPLSDNAIEALLDQKFFSRPNVLKPMLLAASEQGRQLVGERWGTVCAVNDHEQAVAQCHDSNVSAGIAWQWAELRTYPFVARIFIDTWIPSKKVSETTKLELLINLADLGYPRTLEGCRSLALSKDKETWQIAVRCLARIPTEPAAKFLAELATDAKREPAVRELALRVLASQVQWLEAEQVPIAPLCRKHLDPLLADPDETRISLVRDIRAALKGDLMAEEVAALAQKPGLEDRLTAASLCDFLTFEHCLKILEPLTQAPEESLRIAAWTHLRNRTWSFNYRHTNAACAPPLVDPYISGSNCLVESWEDSCPGLDTPANLQAAYALRDRLIAAADHEPSPPCLVAIGECLESLFPDDEAVYAFYDHHEVAINAANEASHPDEDDPQPAADENDAAPPADAEPAADATPDAAADANGDTDAQTPAGLPAPQEASTTPTPPQ